MTPDRHELFPHYDPEEDDAMLFPEPFLRFVRQALNLPFELECVMLFASKSQNKKNILVFEKDGLAIAKFLRGHKSMTGYYITPSAARNFLKYGNKQWEEPIDIEMDQFWANGVECYGVLEPCLTHNPDFQSVIDDS